MSFTKKTKLALAVLACVSFPLMASQDHQDKPQFVVITMDDAVNQEMENSVKKLDHSVPLTFYVNVVQQQGGWTYDESMLDIDCIDENGNAIANQQCISNPESIRNLYSKGHEFALHTYSHPAIASGNEGQPLTDKQIEREMKLNHEFLVLSGVPAEEIKGFRAPFLDTNSSGWDRDNKNQALGALQRVMNELNMEYDSSFTSPPEKSQPRTGVRHCTSIPSGWDAVHCGFDQKDQFSWSALNGGYPNYSTETIPKTQHLFMSHKYVNGTISNVMDTAFGACGQNCSIDEAKNIWLDNFLNHYNDENRPPYGIYLHRQSLSVDNEVAGLNAFIKEIKEKYPNTYFVTSTQLSDYSKLGLDLSADQVKTFLNK